MNYYLISLATADLLAGVLVVPLSIRVDPIDLDGFWAVVFDVEGGGGAFGAAGARLSFLGGGGCGGGGGGQ